MQRKFEKMIGNHHRKCNYVRCDHRTVQEWHEVYHRYMIGGELFQLEEVVLSKCEDDMTARREVIRVDENK